MDYQLENLGPERFQEVCQAILAKAFPNTQCFPVGQRDGGRDALSFYLNQGTTDFVVFQVKFARKPLAERNSHKWLLDIIREEAPKLMKLIPKGAKKYFLLTNVPGTAHPEAGSIDLVHSILSDHLDVPAQCWWRDDINRRLDDAYNIKWSYPEILSSPDILRAVIENGLNEDGKRRVSAIRAFLRDQFERDMDVRFKQIELQNQLFDLFIDVPVTLRESPRTRRRRMQLAIANSIARQHDVQGARTRDASLGAATLLLHSLAQRALNLVVIEGAPGQGKSTIVQYVCQIHRGRILDEDAEDKRIPDEHRNKPVRLPFKIDCRDFALWLTRKNPFASDEAADVPHDWQKSLESFLAAQVKHCSGGATFTVSDLHAVVGLSAILLVFDGLDEVADIGSRREVVDEISRGAARLGEVATSAQSIVTSRPSAFSNSPGLPEKTFLYLELASITQELIDDYANKWLRARRLEGREASDIRRILKDKLSQPHLRELARNPMQLTILLSLVQTRGGSLPDKRTALYDNYVDLFFNRESAKSSLVRDYRDLLINIHRHIAWILHSEAQTKQKRGSVSESRLQQLVRDYLVEEDCDPSLAARLFTGMVERVVALVSRVEGTYEFEVQPLREYFAARHLYNTAPYSPPGHEQRGTLPDRFDALARDFFWHNVARFYAGCYSKGELPSLVDRLEELARSAGYKYTSHPQALAATLLADWVFAQHQKSMKKVMSLILSGPGLRQVTSRGHRYRRDELLVLPKGSGNAELLDRSFEILKSNPPRDYAGVLFELIRANTSRNDARDRWFRTTEALKGTERTRWIEYGIFLGTLSLLSESELERLFDDDSENDQRLVLVHRAGQSGFIEAKESRLETVVDQVLMGEPGVIFRSGASIASVLGQVLSPHRYSLAFQHRHPVSLSELTAQALPPSAKLVKSDIKNVPSFPIAQKCHELINLSIELSEGLAADWATELNHWDQLIEAARRRFGERWAFCILANTAAGIRSKTERGEHAKDLFDKKISLCRRARYARLRAGTARWWETQLRLSSNQLDRAYALLVFFTWSGPKILFNLSELVDRQLRSLDSFWWLKLGEAIQFAAFDPFPAKRVSKVDLSALPEGLSGRALVAYSSRLSEVLADQLFDRYLENYDGDDPLILTFCQKSALLAAKRKPETWQRWLSIISRSYAKGVVGDRYFGYRFTRAVRAQDLPEEIAEGIVEHCDTYPTELVAWAEQVCRQSVAEKVAPVGVVAEQQQWFLRG